MGRSLVTGKLIDPFGGENDLLLGWLDVVGPSFVEDPLRVLRGMQFASRFDLLATLGTIEVCRELVDEFHTLSKDRVWLEFEKWAASPHPQRGLQFLRDTGWIDHFEALRVMEHVTQSERWHPEGSVFAHTHMVLEEVGGLTEGLDRESRVVLTFAALLHDAGKAWPRGQTPFSVDHCTVGVERARDFFNLIGAPNWVAERVCPLIQEHMAFPQRDAAIRRLANRLAPATIEELVMLQRADRNGRGKVRGTEDLDRLLERSCEMAIEAQAPKPLVMGRHLLSFMEPGPEMGKLLRATFEAQLDGKFDTVEDGVAWLVNEISPF
jgi:tRNA nucleotidyltransferase (CCA-adding enzyme)